MKIDSIILAAFITGFFALATAYLSSPSGNITMEGNHYLAPSMNYEKTISASNRGNAINIRSMNTTISDNRVAAGDGAIVIQNNNNNSSSRVTLNGEMGEDR